MDTGQGARDTLGVGLDFIYETLLVPSLDEVSTEYGLLAEAVTHPADFSSVIYRLRPGSEMVRRAAGYD